MAIVNKVALTTIACPAKLLSDINNDNGIFPICQDIRVDNNVNLTFTFSAALSTSEDAQLDVLITNLVCEIITVPTTTDQVVGTILPVTFSYGSEVSDKWLSHSGEKRIPSDETYAVLPFDCKLIGAAFSNKDDNINIDVEINSATFGIGNTNTVDFVWQIRSVRTTRKTNFATEILFSAGDKIGIYCRQVDSAKPDKVVVILYMQITNINNEEQAESFSGKF